MKTILSDAALHWSQVARDIADRVVRIGSGVIESIQDNPQPAHVEEIAW